MSKKLSLFISVLLIFFFKSSFKGPSKTVLLLSIMDLTCRGIYKRKKTCFPSRKNALDQENGQRKKSFTFSLTIESVLSFFFLNLTSFLGHWESALFLFFFNLTFFLHHCRYFLNLCFFLDLQRGFMCFFFFTFLFFINSHLFFNCRLRIKQLWNLTYQKNY